jgi:hypothetical protein
LPGLGWCNCCFAGDAAIRAAVAPLRVSGLGLALVCTHPWRSRTIVPVSIIPKGKELETYVFLLLVDMANLEPDVLFIEGPRWISNDILETLQKDVNTESSHLVASHILLSFAEISAVACILYQAGNRSHSLSQSRAASASLD